MAGSVAPTVVSEAVSEVNSNLNALTEAFRKNKEQCIQLTTQFVCGQGAEDAELFSTQLDNLVCLMSGVKKAPRQEKEKKGFNYPTSAEITKEIYHVSTIDSRCVLSSTTHWFAVGLTLWCFIICRASLLLRQSITASMLETLNTQQVDHIPLGFSILQDLSGLSGENLATHFANLSQCQMSIGRVDVYTR